MYHTLKVKNVESQKKVKPPKGWQFSGDPSFLNLTNNDFNTYFRISNTRIKGFALTGIAVPKNGANKWEVEEIHGQTGIKIEHGTELSNKEAKELAVKLAKNLNKTKFMHTLNWVVVAALLAGLVSFILSKI
ncbi:MAG: hypothetical protein OXU23_08125 [Candidatus Poribacteria bacterium]|nr:hypothetical protein [Candidatus Poribacteria bacterium]